MKYGSTKSLDDYNYHYGCLEHTRERVDIESPNSDDINGYFSDVQGTKHAKLGTFATAMLIINKMIGTGVFSTPAAIYTYTRSIPHTLVLWLLGGIISFAGLGVYLEFGLAIPKSGGELNYLERAYRNPRNLVSCVYAFQMVLLGFSSGNSFAFGKYLLFPFCEDPSEWAVRSVAVGCITFCCVVHSFHPHFGRALFSVLGVVKLAVLLCLIAIGILAVTHVLPAKSPVPVQPIDFSWDSFFTLQQSPYNYALALLQVIYSYKGWENANYVLDEIKAPERTLKIAGAGAIAVVTTLYLLCNLAYFAIIPEDSISASGVIIAGEFCRRILGTSFAGTVLPLFISLSNIGNVLVVSYAHARVNAQFAERHLLPFSNFFKKVVRGAPRNALLLHWVITVIVLVVPPPGELYSLIINLYAYPGTWINAAVCFGLLYLQYNWREEKWYSHGYQSHFIATIVFLIANLFLAVVPFIPPEVNSSVYPYYLVPTIGVMVLCSGGLYWWYLRFRGYNGL